jgi:hypothetical protein
MAWNRKNGQFLPPQVCWRRSSELQCQHGSTLTGFLRLETIPAPQISPTTYLDGSAMIGPILLRSSRATAFLLLIVCLTSAGCRSPYYADRGAGIGALAGAGAGAIIGDATGGNAGTGALIGAGLGAITGATVGDAMDEMQAQNRAEIAAQMGRQVQTGAATIEEVVAMSRSGVDPILIQNYVRTSGMSRPLSAADVIALHNQGVSTDVIQIMQTPPPVAVATRPTAVVVEEHYYGPPPCYAPHFGYYHGHHGRGPRTSVGFSVSN